VTLPTSFSSLKKQPVLSNTHYSNMHCALRIKIKFNQPKQNHVLHKSENIILNNQAKKLKNQTVASIISSFLNESTAVTSTLTIWSHHSIYHIMEA
jgi:hypothetical protein